MEREIEMKVGIIRCQLTEDMCPGSTIAAGEVMAFAETDRWRSSVFFRAAVAPGKRLLPGPK
jgi:hypothetical protein